MLNNSSLPLPIFKFLDYLEKDKGYSSRTISSYASDLSIFFRWVFLHRGLVHIEFAEQKEHELLSDIDISPLTFDLVNNVAETEIKEFLRFTDDVLKLSPTAKTRKIACLKSFYEYLTLS